MPNPGRDLVAEKQQPPQDELDSQDQQLHLPIDQQDDQDLETQADAEQPVEQPQEQPEQPAEQPAATSIRDLASRYGVDLSEYQDDEAAVRHLAEQARAAREHQELAQYGQQFVQHAADGSWQDYLAWKQQQQQSQQNPEEPKLWDPPEWNPSWLQQVRQDESGNLVPDTQRGGTPETVAKIQRYVSWRQDQQDKFWQDPFTYLKPFVENQAEQRARDLIRQELSQYGEQIDARHFITNNKDWLYRHDESGQVQYQDGRPVMSQEGQVFYNALQRVNDKNWSTADKQEYALEQLQLHRQMESLKRQDPKARKEDELAQAAGYQPSSGATEHKTPDAQDNVASPQNPNASFAEMLRADLAAAGFDPNDELVKV